MTPCRVSIVCGLCTEKVAVEYDMGEAELADTLVEQEALAAGFIALGKVSTAERRRALTWVCKACAGDIAEGVGRAKTLPPPGPDEAATYLMAGRAKQRPTGLPTLNSPAPPDGVAAVGLSADPGATLTTAPR